MLNDGRAGSDFAPGSCLIVSSVFFMKSRYLIFTVSFFPFVHSRQLVRSVPALAAGSGYSLT